MVRGNLTGIVRCKLAERITACNGVITASTKIQTMNQPMEPCLV